jgi:hypothetical protein
MMPTPGRGDFTVAARAYGRAVLANRAFRKGEHIMQFGGKLFAPDELPVPYDAANSSYLHVRPQEYLGPSGGLDDLVNHSCEPNAGLRFSPRGITLIAIRGIRPAEEITFDYSTTLEDDDWEMDCRCGSPRCRGRVRDFKHLPRRLQQRYARLGIVAEHALRAAGISHCSD